MQPADSSRRVRCETASRRLPRRRRCAVSAVVIVGATISRPWIDLIQEYPQHTALHLPDLTDGTLKRPDRDAARPHDEDHTVTDGRKAERVRDDHGRAIEEHQIEQRLGSAENCLQARRTKQIMERLLGSPTGHDNSEIVDVGALSDLVQRPTVGERGGQTIYILNAEHVVKCRTPEVGIDETDATSALGGNDRQVRRSR